KIFDEAFHCASVEAMVQPNHIYDGFSQCPVDLDGRAHCGAERNFVLVVGINSRPDAIRDVTDQLLMALGANFQRSIGRIWVAFEPVHFSLHLLVVRFSFGSSTFASPLKRSPSGGRHRNAVSQPLTLPICVWPAPEGALMQTAPTAHYEAFLVRSVAERAN